MDLETCGIAIISLSKRPGPTIERLIDNIISWQKAFRVRSEKMSVVLATDGRAHTSKAVDYALEYARLHREALYVVYVIGPRHEENREGTIGEAKRHLEDIKQRAVLQGVEATTLLETGGPAESIFAVAERVNATAVVVGTSGKTVLDRVLIGSVSEHVVRNSPCTVIVVK